LDSIDKRCYNIPRHKITFNVENQETAGYEI